MSNKHSIVAILQGIPVQKGQGPLFTFPRNRDSKYYWIYIIFCPFLKTNVMLKLMKAELVTCLFFPHIFTQLC